MLTNRTGFIVLHPVDGVAGRPVTDPPRRRRARSGRASPRRSTRRCPFRDIRALSHEIAPGAWATCTMEGDTFEMEDQRNWSDASYKTYVRPLARPWPYTLPKGEPVAQAVRLAISGDRARGRGRGGARPVRVAIGGESGRLPAIGLGVPAEEAAHALAAGDLARAPRARAGSSARSTCAAAMAAPSSNATAPSPS